jgi:hypothetical protein
MKVAVCSLFLFLALTAAAQAAEPGDVVFSELMWMGSSGSTSDEWIELYNRGDASIDLSGWTIARLTGDEVRSMLVIPEGRIPANETFLISNYPADDERSRLQSLPQLVDTALSLPNSKLQLFLYNGAPPSAQLIDVADDGKGAPMGGDNDLKRSMVRMHIDRDGSIRESWATADQSSGWDPDSTERGTPGIALNLLKEAIIEEGNTTTQVAATAWAGVKFRHVH